MSDWVRLRSDRRLSVDAESCFTATDPLSPGELGDAACRPNSCRRVRSTSSSSTSMITSGRALSTAEISRPAAAIRSGVSLIEIALVAVVGEMRRASSTIRSRSIVSLRSALLK